MHYQTDNSPQTVDNKRLVTGIMLNTTSPVDIMKLDGWVLRPILPARFFRKVRFDQSGCWIWTGTTGFHPAYRYHRYGQIRLSSDPVTRAKGRRTTAHKFAYLYVKGSVPIGYDVDHLCQNKLCVNPSHLEAVSHKENIRRRNARRAK